MIVIDTSALVAIVMAEPASSACQDAIDRADRVSISAATLTEALLVATRKGVDSEMQALIDVLKLVIEPVTEARARQAVASFRRFGKSRHPAALNFGDCFTHALAWEFECPLLFVGDDFAKTDVVSALAR